LINNNCYHFSTNSTGTDNTFLATIDTTNKTNLLCVWQGKQIPPHPPPLGYLSLLNISYFFSFSVWKFFWKNKKNRIKEQKN
jgi:hypothetical protein